ncbi:MAG: signal recognition particle-docking protein FtsY [Candidatus Dependentiae bacterium]|nr:signal recognition particle-docking protein FtsY [Candidatus Dependentiae bacterium]
MFGFLKNTLQKIYNQFTTKIQALFARNTVDAAALKELETILIASDAGVKTTRTIIEHLKQTYQSGKLPEGHTLKNVLEQQLLALLQTKKAPTHATVYLLVGINGSGKTTFAGKLANSLSSQGKKVLLVAADTFRAAAPEQLTRWAERSNTAILVGNPNQDPASVVFTGCTKFKNEQFDTLIVDTAGRLQTKTNLMKELEKIRNVIGKQLPHHNVCALLTVDSMLGQNSFEQAKLFHESTHLDGIVLTKMDGTGKGGIVFAITQELGIPIAYITYGEQLDQLKVFDAQEYVEQLLNG